MSRAVRDPAGTTRRTSRHVRTSPEILNRAGAALTPFGYRPIDAEFLAAVALLGGYFVRRQYRAFAQCSQGGAEFRLVQRLERNGHATAVVGKTLYRLRGTRLLKAIGYAGKAPSPRARRTVKQRLLALDHYVVRRDQGSWLLTAAEKTACFASLGVASASLPAPARMRAGKPRPFADGFPIQQLDGDPRVFAFSYAHAGAGQSGIVRHLCMYQALAASLADLGHDCEWVVLADTPAQFARLRQAWRRWRDGLERDWIEKEYFELRQAVEKRLWNTLTRQTVERYATLRSSLQGASTERRYAKWVERGAPARKHGICLADSCSYREVLLDHNYSVVDAIVRRA